MKTYILTGGTGYLGSHLVSNLLTSGHKIIFIGRAKAGCSLSDRIYGLYGEKYIDQIFSIEDDMNSYELETLISNIGKISSQIDGLWHLAADLSFKDKDRDRVMNINIGGSKKMALIALHFNCLMFYISTAYVHGRRSGISLEEIGDPARKYNNSYEESKYLSECELKNIKNLRLVIFRPSILIDRNVNHMSNFGYYSFLISLDKFRKSLNIQNDKEIILPLPLLYSRESTLNLMPVDVACDWIYRISQDQNAEGKIFNICNARPFNVGLILKQTLLAMNIKIPLFTAPKIIVVIYLTLFSFIGGFIRYTRPISRRIKYFKWYMIESVHYDMTNTQLFLDRDLNGYFNFSDDYIYSMASKFKEKINK